MRKVILIAIIIITLFALVACNGDNALIETETPSFSFDYDTSADLEQLSSKGDAILIGQFTKVIDEVNIARDPSNVEKENLEVEILSERLMFTISNVLKGEITDEVIVVSQIKTFYDQDFEYYVEPVFNTDVILFVNYNQLINILEPLEYMQFEAASFPFMFTLEDDKTVKIIEKATRKSEFKEKAFKLDKLMKLIE